MNNTTQTMTPSHQQPQPQTFQPPPQPQPQHPHTHSPLPTPSSSSLLQPHYLLFAFFLVYLVYRLLKRKPTSRDFVYIVGERNAGKTKLFYKLTKGKDFETVPSVKNNSTKEMVGNRVKTVVDVTGDNHSKEEFLSGISRAFRIVMVVDGAAPATFAASAELLYRISISKAFQQNQPDFVILLNKSDRVDYVGANMFKKQIEDEIERKKLSRLALHQQKQSEQDHLREQKSRYSLPFKVIQTSFANGKLDAVQAFIEEGVQL